MLTPKVKAKEFAKYGFKLFIPIQGCTECEMSAPGAYDIDIEADDINVTDTATVIWEIA